jgi:APA family basic amino acid/polyamine antiporter
METIESRKAPGLVRGLGLWAATAVVIGGMIGQGIFLVTSQIARDVGSEIGGLAVWLIGGVVVLLGAFCYAELGAAMPEAGGDYVYLSRGLGPVWGFLYGWTSALIMRPGSAATIAAGLLRFTGFLLPSVATPIFTWHIPLPFQPYQFTFTASQPLAAAVVAAVTAINYFGVRTAGRIQIVLSGLKVAGVVTIVVLGLALGRVSGIHSGSKADPLGYGTAGAFLTALVPVMAAYNGFQQLGWVGGEIVNPQKNIPRAAILGVLSVAGLYVLINLAYFRVLTFSQVAQSQHVASDAVALVTGQNGAKWLTIAMMISALGALHVGFLTGPRVPYAMARDGQFFSFAKRVQPAFHTPSGALIFQGCVSTLLVLTGTFEELYSLTVFAIWTFFVLTAVTLIRLRINEPTLPRPYLAWGYPWTPLFFAGAAFAMTANLWLVRPVRSSIGLAVILLGIPFFHHWRRSSVAPEPNPSFPNESAVS